MSYPCGCAPYCDLRCLSDIRWFLAEYPYDTSGTGTLWSYMNVEEGTWGPNTHSQADFGDVQAQFLVGAGLPDSSSAQGEFICEEGSPRVLLGSGASLRIYQDTGLLDPTAGTTRWGRKANFVPGATNCAASASCYPETWLFAGYQGAADAFRSYDYFSRPPTQAGANFHSLLITTKQNLMFLPDPSRNDEIEALDCCYPNGINHDSPVLMEVTIGGQYVLRRFVATDTAFPTNDMENCNWYWSFRAESIEQIGGLSDLTSSLADGFSLFSGWGPSIIPSTGSTTAVNPQAFVSLSIVFSHDTTSWGIASYIRQFQPRTPQFSPGINEGEVWYSDAILSYAIPPGLTVYDLMPITVNLPAYYRDSVTGLDVSIDPIPVTFRFVSNKDGDPDNCFERTDYRQPPSGTQIIRKPLEECPCHCGCPDIDDPGEEDDNDWFLYMVENLGG